MKKKSFKIIIISLCIALTLSLSACSYANGIWDYFSGNFDLFSNYSGTSGSASPPTSPTPSTGGDINVNVGEAQTQTGGLADVITSSTESVIELYTIYYFQKGTEMRYGSSVGSGVILSKDANGLYIVTNTQLVVISQELLLQANQQGLTYAGKEVTVRFSTGIESEAQLIYDDTTADVALLYVSKDNLGQYFEQMTSATLTKTITKGEKVIAIGNPFSDGTFGLCATAGVISTVSREIGIGDNRTVALIQTDTAVNSGNTGGGLFNAQGKLVGIVNGKIVAEGVEGLGFALPMEKVLDILHVNGYLTDVTV